MLYYTLVTLYVLICFLLLVVVLLQQGKGGDIAAAFGGSSSQTAFGARSGATMLTRATAVLGTLFMLGAFALAIVNRAGSAGSVVGGIGAPTETQPAAPALPMTTPLTPPAGGGSTTTLPAGSGSGSETAKPPTPPPAQGAGSGAGSGSGS
jgi:preprotein translocase subunit SecG